MLLNTWQDRTKLLLGEDKLTKLSNTNVLIAGLGGVGGMAAEMICRAGIGNITIIDSDKFQISNINRQVGALNSTVGKNKADVMAERLMDINPTLKLKVYNEYINQGSIEKVFANSTFDFVIDAIDTIQPKYNLILKCLQEDIKLVSSMGAGGRVDPTLVKITDISKSFNCKLALNLRKKLHKVGHYTGFKVVFSSEKVDRETIQLIENESNKKSFAGTISYMPAIFGLYCAYEVINAILELQVN